MDERIRSIWVTRYPPRTIREYLTETGILAHPLWFICVREILQERNKNDNQ